MIKKIVILFLVLCSFSVMQGNLMPSVLNNNNTLFYNCIQSISSNHLGGYETVCTNYSFTNQAVWSKKIHTRPDQSTIEETFIYAYDHADRPTTTTYQLNNNDPVILSKNYYDDLGRLKEKALHDEREQISYEYNIRSWLKNIDSTPYKETLHYTDVSQARYNGNIAQMDWQSELYTKKQSYHFQYDGLNRLTQASYKQNDLSISLSNYSESMTYDKMGNITHLTRHAPPMFGSNLLDNLEIKYNGNQLKSVIEYGDPTRGFVQAEQSNAQYAYNRNGSMVRDDNSGITNITYNLINLPQQIDFSGMHNTRYVYGMDGTKRQVIHSTAERVLSTSKNGKNGKVSQSRQDITDYCGNIVYENGAIKYILNPEGYVILENN